MFVQFFIFVLSIQQIVLANTNYCDKSLCDEGDRHIGCNNNGRFAQNCPKSAEIINLSNFKDKIVGKHNEIRNKVASGNLRPYNSASRMATMQWDDELAKLAELNVKRCDFNHDKCRNTREFRYSGQNLGSIGHFPDMHLEPEVSTIIENWYNEHIYANNNVIKYFVPPNGKSYGHFTVMVADRNYKVGCAVLRYLEGENMPMVNYRITCNYAISNMEEQPIYVFGKPGTGCKTGTNPKYPALCSTNEKYVV